MVNNQGIQQQTLFFTQERQQRLDLVTHLIPNNRQPILLRGPEASGKSFFIGQFVKQTPKNWLVCKLELDELAISPVDAIEQAVNAIKQTDKSITTRLSAWSNQEKIVIVIIEDAHLIGSDCVMRLFQLSESYSCLRLLITSSDNLGDSIERRCQLIDLEPFTQKQTVEYAKARVSSKGLDFINLAGIDEVVLFIETGGLPGRINDVLEQIQLSPLHNGTTKGSSNKAVILFVLAVSMALAAFLTYEFWGNDDLKEPTSVLPVEKKPLAQAIVAKEPLVKQAKEQKQMSASGKSIEVLEKTKSEQKNDELLAVKDEKITKDPGLQVKPSPQVVAEVEEKIENLEQVKPVLSVKPEVELAEKEIKKTPLMRQHEWLRAQPSTSYTLQLMGVSEERSILQYMASKKGVNGLHYFRHKRNNGAWYTVVYGVYADKASAEKVAKNLPTQLKSLKPWVRRIDTVKADMFQ